MIRKLLKREPLVELDNITNNIVILAECFIASEVLNTRPEIMKGYKANGEPLSLNITHYTLEGNDVKKKGVISDKEGREIVVMEIAFKDNRVSMYTIAMKGKIKGKKVKIKKHITQTTQGNYYGIADLANTLDNVIECLQ